LHAEIFPELSVYFLTDTAHLRDIQAHNLDFLGNTEKVIFIQQGEEENAPETHPYNDGQDTQGLDT